MKSYLTTVDRQHKLSRIESNRFRTGTTTASKVIRVDEEVMYQTMDGFGLSITGSTAWLMKNAMTKTQTDAFLRSVFHPTDGIGVHLLRQPIGGSDQNAPDQPRSYCENGGEPDPDLLTFSIEYDIRSGITGYIRQAMELNPDMKVMGTLWSVPEWMLGGTWTKRAVKKEYYEAYARYLVRFIRAYEEQGIPIWAITPQNEPVFSHANFGNNMTAEQQRVFIREHLGPLFEKENIRTNILVFDHNWDHWEYVDHILADPDAAKYIAGSAWHYYGGAAEEQSRIAANYPDKGIYFTEASTPTYNVDWPIFMTDFQGARNYFDILNHNSRTYIQWTLLSDRDYGPGFCIFCGSDAYVDKKTGEIDYSLAFYLLGHFSKFVKPGALRIDSTDLGNGGIRSTAFRNPDGSKVLVLYNDSKEALRVGIQWGIKSVEIDLDARAVITLHWSGKQEKDDDSRPIRKTIFMREAGSEAYVSARYWGDNLPLELLSVLPEAGEGFEVADAGDGAVSLRSCGNGVGVQVSAQETEYPLRPNSPWVFASSVFDWIPVGDHTVQLRSVWNDRYVTVKTVNGKRLLYAEAESAEQAARFVWREADPSGEE